MIFKIYFNNMQDLKGRNIYYMFLLSFYIYPSFTNICLYHTTSISIIRPLIKHMEKKYEKERKQTWLILTICNCIMKKNSIYSV